MRLIASSDPGAVNLDHARRLLEERVVLTTAVVRELQRCGSSYSSGRPRAALNLLRRWVGEGYEAKVETHPSDGLDDMLVSEGAEDLMAELRAGAKICEALAMLWTADTRREFEGDSAAIRRLLDRYPY
jgi:hypothetical protein